MAESTTTPLPRVRTFARDLENERRKRGLPAPVNDRALGETAPAPTEAIPTPLQKVSLTPPATTAVVVPAAPKPVAHIVAVPAPANRVSDAVLTTRREEMVKEAEQLPTSIPPFHDLMKRSGKSLPKNPTGSANKDGGQITITDDESGATIITDTKADRFKVAPSIFSSLNKWWARYQADRKARRAPKYVVPETDRRKGIIQQATSHSGKAITDDRAQLRAQVMRRDTVPKAQEPGTTWTPNTEAVFPLLEAPDAAVPARVTNVQVTPRQRGQESPVVVSPPVPPPPAVLPPAPVISSETPVAAMKIKTPEAAAVSPREPEPVVADEKVVAGDEFPLGTAMTVPRDEVSARLDAWQNSTVKRRFTTNLLSAAVVCAVVLITGTVFGVRAYLTVPEPVPAPVYEGVLISAPTSNIPLPTLDRAAFIQALAIASDTRSVPAVELFFVNDSTVVSPATILSLLNPSIDQNLAQNVRSIVFGWYNKDIPFIVLDIADKASVWGGLLKEESMLTTTLTPFFTFPTTLDGAFIDRKITSLDIRLLVDKTGNEYLAYSFISDNMVIITKNHETLLLIASLASEVK